VALYPAGQRATEPGVWIRIHTKGGRAAPGAPGEPENERIILTLI
jgi:hypothetical protein